MKKTKLSLVVVLTLALGLGTSVAFAKSDNAKVQSDGKSKSKMMNLKNFEKPDVAKGQTNAQVHKVKTQAVVENLEQVATQEESAGNTQVSNQIEQVVQEQTQAQAATVDAIEQVENRGKVKTFIVGVDYKNLGQLRSDLVHNRNEIRKLTQSLTQAQTPDNKTLIEAQLATLTQERERIKTIITTNESSFSLFGWVSRFLANYEQTPINEQEETQLTTEVETAIDAAAETTVPATATPAETTTAPTAPAAPVDTKAPATPTTTATPAAVPTL